MDFMLLEHDLFGRGNMLDEILVLWGCTVFRTGR